MPRTRAADRAHARVESITRDGGRIVATLRMRHASFRPDRFWSFCDVVVTFDDEVVPARDAAALRIGDEVDFVLVARAEASRAADAPGHYSCRLHAADEAPMIPIERSTERIFGGLIERSEPPAAGDLVLHLGSGLTCYVEPAGEGPFPAESLEHGSWSEFILEEPLRVAWLGRAAPRA